MREKKNNHKNKSSPSGRLQEEVSQWSHTQTRMKYELSLNKISDLNSHPCCLIIRNTGFT